VRYTRKDFITLAASAGAGSLLLGALPARRASAHAGMPTYITNALEHQTYDLFQGWFAWLKSAGVPGFLAEHGVPNSTKPLPVAEVDKWLVHFDKVYQILDSNVEVIPAVTAQVASLYTGRGAGGLQIYGPDRDDVPIWRRNFFRAFEQAKVVESESHLPAGLPTGSLRGMNTSAGAVTQTGFSRSSPGNYGQHYVYPDQADFAYLRGRGHNVTRITFRWERVQPRLNGPLNSAELARFKSCFDAASAVGMKVIPNVHNFGHYAQTALNYQPLGSRSVPISALKDLWVRLAQAWKDHGAIASYDIMNEPHTLPGGVPTWEQASQAAVEGIRSVDATRRIWVVGYNKRKGFNNGLFCFVANHPRAWISGADNVGYVSHAYYGPGPSYRMTYDEAVAYWKNRGY
jgi:hypothetical protein